jgi:hypothetical protein
MGTPGVEALSVNTTLSPNRKYTRNTNHDKWTSELEQWVQDICHTGVMNNSLEQKIKC